jgi:hypothetical protein
VPCSESAPCSEGRECASGACIGCTTDEQCGEAEVCRGGICGAVCAIDADCPVAAAWLTGAEAPPAAFFGCRLHSDGLSFSFCDGSGPLVRGPVGLFCDPCLASFGGCGTGRECVDGNCTCETNADCPDELACRGGVCGTCAENADCRCDQVCEVGTCAVACTTDADCPGAKCDVASGRCPDCLTDGDCGATARCYTDGCVVPCDVARDCALPDGCRASGRCNGCERPLGPPSFPPATRCM